MSSSPAEKVPVFNGVHFFDGVRSWHSRLARRTGHLNADMDDRSVFNVALTAGEVNGLYDCPGKQLPIVKCEESERPHIESD